MLDLATGGGIGVGIGVGSTGTFRGWVDVGRASGSIVGFQAKQGHLDSPRLRATSLVSLIKEGRWYCHVIDLSDKVVLPLACSSFFSPLSNLSFALFGFTRFPASL